MTGDRFRVDLDELGDVVVGVRRRHQQLEALADRVSAEVARLHAAWDGAAASAHAGAQEQWDEGFAEMRAALAAMGDAAAGARAGYSAAAEANTAMWRQLG